MLFAKYVWTRPLHEAYEDSNPTPQVSVVSWLRRYAHSELVIGVKVYISKFLRSTCSIQDVAYEDSEPITQVGFWLDSFANICSSNVTAVSIGTVHRIRYIAYT
jgi:hypothetical protein